MKGWRPRCPKASLYDQLFQHYFDYPQETERTIQHLNRPLQWFPPHWFLQGQSLASGRMGRVYIMSCRIPYQKKSKTMIIREINVCMIKQQTEKEDNAAIPNRVIGITAIPLNKHHRYKLALVSEAVEFSLEQLIPQVDQWTFQKTCRLAMSLASAVRDMSDVHPNLQPRNVLVHPDLTLAIVDGLDDWPTIPLSTRYGRYPYIAPEIAYGYATTISKQANVYALGIMLWQLGSGVLFPNSAQVSPQVYQLNSLEHFDHDYHKLVQQCLAKDPLHRPTAESICNSLVPILMSSKKNHALHTNEIRDRQIIIAKYLVRCDAKHDLQALLQGASLSKRIMMQVTMTLDWHAVEKEATVKLCHNNNKRKHAPHDHVMTKKDVYRGVDLPELMQLGYV